MHRYVAYMYYNLAGSGLRANTTRKLASPKKNSYVVISNLMMNIVPHIKNKMEHLSLLHFERKARRHYIYSVPSASLLHHPFLDEKHMKQVTIYVQHTAHANGASSSCLAEDAAFSSSGRTCDRIFARQVRWNTCLQEKTTSAPDP